MYRNFISLRLPANQVRWPRVHRIWLAGYLLLSSAWSNSVTANAVAADESDYHSCITAFKEQPDQYDSALCFYSLATQGGTWQQAAATLDNLQSDYPHITWLYLVRGYIATEAGELELALAKLQQAAEAFETAAELRGELLARANLRNILFRLQQPDAAAAQMPRIIAIGEQASVPELKVRALVLQAQESIDTGRNLGRAIRNLQPWQAKIDQIESVWLRTEVLNNLAGLSHGLGQYDMARRHYEQVASQANARDDTSGLALARFNIANSRLEALLESPEPGGQTELLNLSLRALDSAKRANNTRILSWAHRLLGELLFIQDPARASKHLQSCMKESLAHGEMIVHGECSWIAARIHAVSEPAAAATMMRQALEAMETTQDLPRQAIAWRHYMRLSWLAQSPIDALQTSKLALGVIENLRDLQQGDSRAALLSAWTRDYHWLVGQLLREAALSDTPQAWIAEAFAISEQMRARSLFDALQRLDHQATSMQPATTELVSQRNLVLRGLVDYNRQLLAAPDGPKAATIRNKLATLELREVDLRERLFAADEANHTGAPAWHAASLDEVQHRLYKDEAVVIFQTGAWRTVRGEFGGGAWALIITPNAVSMVELPDRTTLKNLSQVVRDTAVVAARPMAGSSLHANNPAAAMHNQAASAANERLLRPVLAKIPSHTQHLIIVADSALHSLPFATLRAGPQSPPLINELQISFAPSATLWQHWRSSNSTKDTRNALVLASPALEKDLGKHQLALPFAQLEGESIAAALGPQTLLLQGANASELNLKQADLETMALVHFATHAIVDDQNSNRSAVVLAAGDSSQDGLLQTREIVDLNFLNQIVVLSSCASATGTPLRGEGVLGLARGFFLAGARTVVGSLWPVRDDHAAAFFEPFYMALAVGESVTAALNSAQRILYAKGYPTEAWAGFMVMGDGSAALAPVRRDTAGTQTTGLVSSLLTRSLALLAAVLVAVMLLALLIARVKSAKQRQPEPRETF